MAASYPADVADQTRVARARRRSSALSPPHTPYSSWFAIEVRRQEIADRVRDEQRVIVRSIYQNVILAPCLILTEAEADRIVAALNAVLATTSPEGRPLVAAGSEG